MAWLAVFFLVPMVYLGKTSLEQGLFPIFTFKWAWGNFHDAISLYHTQFVRSFEYAGLATVIALVGSYTLAWETILADDGVVANTMRHLHLLGSNGRLLATSFAVVAGITYNFLPFMVLPLYVSLEQIDHRLIEAANDLYASRWKAFLRVTLPLSLPGVFAGTLLTFIPAAGDFINAQLLGTPKQYMIGNVIQSQFLSIRDYPTAAALSFVLMALILAGILVYARALGTERLTGMAAGR